MTRVVLIVLAALALSGGCSNPAPPRPVRPIALDGPATCLDLCRHLDDLGCPAARPTDQGASCVDVCSTVQQSGITYFDLNCRTRAPDCAAVDRCP